MAHQHSVNDNHKHEWWSDCEDSAHESAYSNVSKQLALAQYLPRQPRHTKWLLFIRRQLRPFYEYDFPFPHCGKSDLLNSDLLILGRPRIAYHGN